MSKIPDFARLIKYRLSAAVTLSAITGYLIYKPAFEWNLFFLASGIYLISGASAALNQYTEQKYDALMDRTKDRPIPANRIKSTLALYYALFLYFAGISILMITGPVPVLLSLLNVIMYNLIYTRLKRITPLAIIAGALVGALPPLIGFSAAGGTSPEMKILLFSGFMFIWQIPHFWLIGMRYAGDYKAAGFKMISPLRENPFSGQPGQNNFRIIFILINSFSIVVMAVFIIISFISAV